MMRMMVRMGDPNRATRTIGGPTHGVTDISAVGAPLA